MALGTTQQNKMKSDNDDDDDQKAIGFGSARLENSFHYVIKSMCSLSLERSRVR